MPVAVIAVTWSSAHWMASSKGQLSDLRLEAIILYLPLVHKQCIWDSAKCLSISGNEIVILLKYSAFALIDQ